MGHGLRTFVSGADLASVANSMLSTSLANHLSDGQTENEDDAHKRLPGKTPGTSDLWLHLRADVVVRGARSDVGTTCG